MVELVLQDADSPLPAQRILTMTISLFQQIIKSLPRRKITEIVATYESDKWCKNFSTFDHLVTMIYALLAGQARLRDLEASFNGSPADTIILAAKGLSVRH